VIPSSFASVTYTATAGGVAIPAAALTVAGVQVKRCTGVAETAVMRYRVDGQANLVSGTVGRPVAINEAIEINGFQALMQMRGFSTSGTAVVQWTCWR
jgi:hypothetical protein